MRSFERSHSLAAYQAFDRMGRLTRIHMFVRQRLAPLNDLENLVPLGGKILDFGCGHGLFTIQMALASGRRRVHAVDLSAKRIAIAETAALSAGVSDRIDFEIVNRGWTPELNKYDVVLISDVLYLMSSTLVAHTVRSAAQSLKPNGILVIKEIATRPLWKHLLGGLQEFLAFRVVRITRGTSLNLRPLASVKQELKSMGLTTQDFPLHKGYYYAHAAIVAFSGEISPEGSRS